jgi:UDP-N-acetylmuramoyl-tripeptide--D-alanyl-D-alanine ligase
MAFIQRPVEATAPVVDLTVSPPALPSRWSLPVLLQVPDTLTALQKVAAYWRRRHSPRVIGITGSVGKTTTKELITDVLSRRYRTLKSESPTTTKSASPSPCSS